MPLLSRRLLVLALVLASSVTSLAGCSKASDGDEGVAGTSTTSAAPAPVVGFTVTGLDANATTAPDEATVAAVTRTLDGWVAAAVIAPLHTGAPAPDLAGVFTAAALERLADPAVRASLVDEGMPAATTAITAEAANATLASVAGPDGVVGVVAARVDLRVHAVGPSAEVDIVHQGDLVLVPDGGAWKIDSFTMRTDRNSRP